MIRILAALSALIIPALVGAPALATGGGQTVRTTIHLAAVPVENLCNGDPVVLTGDLYVRTTTRPSANGGMTVESVTDGRNLRGPGLVTGLSYWGDQDAHSYSYYAPPPYPSTQRVTQWTKLIPNGNAPSMYLVFVLRQVIAPDDTVVPTFVRAYLKCTQPTCSHQKES